MVTFLILENLGVWISYTFAMQNGDATTVEQHFFGETNWLVIERITIPIIIFFRFHSSVLLVECWKMTYSLEEHEDQEEHKDLNHKEMVAMRKLEDYDENSKNGVDHVEVNTEEEHSRDGRELGTSNTHLV